MISADVKTYVKQQEKNRQQLYLNNFNRSTFSKLEKQLKTDLYLLSNETDIFRKLLPTTTSLYIC